MIGSNGNKAELQKTRDLKCKLKYQMISVLFQILFFFIDVTIELFNK